jgi:tetratricopeptide (TPR) repeat protein
VPDRLLVDLGGDGQATVQRWPDGEFPQEVSRAPLAWPLDANAMEDLRWYLEDYLLAPYGVWEDHGPAVQEKLAGWGDEVFGSVFGAGPARDAYQRARDRGLEVVFRSAEPRLLELPWELMRDGAGPVALGLGGISRSLPVADRAETLAVPGGRLRVLMVIARPEGTRDVGYQMVARPLLERLDAVRGEVHLTVLRPPTFDMLQQVLKQAADAGEPFHVMHFDGHGAMPGRPAGGGAAAGGRPMMGGQDEGVLAFEQPGGGGSAVRASKVAGAVADGRVPVVVLNACQSGAIGKQLEASVATALLNAGCAAVVAMAYSVYAVAAAEFMAAFYEALFAGSTVGQAVTAGRKRLFDHDGRPSPKGDMPLADWLVPVHYLRKDVSFPQARTTRPAAAPSLDVMLDQIRAVPSEREEVKADPLAAVGTFVGRDDLFYELESAARIQRVVVLSGPGGTGKTELAKGFARWWRDTGGVDDPRLVCWHSFEPGVASFGLDGVITAIGLGVFGADFALLDIGQRLAQAKRLLEQCRALLVWDNFESVREMPDAAGATPTLDEAGCAQLREFLEWVRDHSRSTALITSRAPEDWLGQARRIEVSGLNRTQAAQYVDYLLAPFPAAQRRREHRSFGELLEWLDGHPLAMRFTLPRLDSTSPGDLLAGLQGITPLPAEEAAGTGRLSSLGASITYSFAHLPEERQRLIPAVGLLHGVADTNLLMAFSDTEGVPSRFAGVSREQWTALLEDAARVGLLTGLGGGMYQIHPALPGYLAAGWQAGDPDGYRAEREVSEQALCTACAAFSRRLTQQIASGNAGAAYTIIMVQRRTLGAMLGHALDRQAWDDAGGIVRALDDYWDTRGFSEEAAAWADRILAATDGLGQDTPAAGALWLYTTVHQATRQKDAGHPDQAGQTYRQALAYLQDQPETDWTRENVAVLYHQLGMTAQARGRLDEADDWYRKALTIQAELGDQSRMASGYHQLGMVAQDGGRLKEAEGWFRKSLTIEENLGNQPGMAISYHYLGMVAQKQGRLEEAEGWSRRSLTVSQNLGDRPGMADSYHLLGTISCLRGQLNKAEELYRRSLTIREDLGNQRERATLYLDLGNLAKAQGGPEDAENWYRKSLAIREGLGDRSGTGDLYNNLAALALDQRRLEDAQDWCLKSMAIKEELGDRPGTAVVCLNLGGVALQQKRLDEAEGWFRKALAIEQDIQNQHGLAASYWRLGVIDIQRNQLRRALEWMVRSVTVFADFPNQLTEPAPGLLAQLTNHIGMDALDRCWRQVTGQPVPQVVRDYISSHRDQKPDKRHDRPSRRCGPFRRRDPRP